MIDFGLAGTFEGKLSLFHRYMNGHGGPPVDASERFLKFAAECELMAKFTPSRANKTVWRRWRRDGFDALNLSSGRTPWFIQQV
jgi:hypothetical protein